jgi:hypothetical protein
LLSFSISLYKHDEEAGTNESGKVRFPDPYSFSDSRFTLLYFFYSHRCVIFCLHVQSDAAAAHESEDKGMLFLMIKTNIPFLPNVMTDENLLHLFSRFCFHKGIFKGLLQKQGMSF